MGAMWRMRHRLLAPFAELPCRNMAPLIRSWQLLGVTTGHTPQSGRFQAPRLADWSLSSHRCRPCSAPSAARMNWIGCMSESLEEFQ